MGQKAEIPKSILKKVSQFDCDFFEKRQNNRTKNAKLIRFNFEAISQPHSVRKEPIFLGKIKKKLKPKECEVDKKQDADRPGSEQAENADKGAENAKKPSLHVSNASETKNSPMTSANETLEKTKTRLEKVEGEGIEVKALYEGSVAMCSNKGIEKEERQRKKRRRRKRGSRQSGVNRG